MEKTKSSKTRKMRTRYRRNLRLVAILCLVLGLALGFVVGRMTVPSVALPIATDNSQITIENNEQPAVVEDGQQTAQQVVQPTAAPVVTATAAPTATPEPTVVVVPYGTNQAIPAQINSSGSARTSLIGAYEDLNFTLRVDRYLTSEYYVATHGTSYNLEGTESGVTFELMLTDYTGVQTINPQNVLDIRLETASGVVEDGYKLRNAEIGGESGFSLTTNVPTSICKRFTYSPSKGEMAYLVVTAYVDAAPTAYKFELGAPVRPTAETTITYATLDTTSKGAEVEKLQMRLVLLGYLTGTADGSYGPATEAAVKAAQAAYGMEQTGIADDALQQKLYAEDAQ